MKILTSVISILIGANIALALDAAWKQTTETSDGIKVFRKEIPSSKTLAVRGIGAVSAPLPLVATIIFDCTHATEWIEDLKESRVLRWINPMEFIEYDRIGTPFIMKDRDFVTHVVMKKDPLQHTITIQYKSVDDSSAPKTSYIRGQIIEGIFTLTASGSQTEVDAAIHCDLKGAIPKWIVNFFQKDWPITTFRSLRKQATKADLKVDPRFQFAFISVY